MWCWDFIFDRTETGTTLKWLSVLDEYTRECLVLRVDRQVTRQGGRPTKNAKPLKKPRRVDEVVANLPASAWKRMSVAEGSQGPRLYEYAEVTVWFSEKSRPTDQRERLLVRRSVGQDSELKYQCSNAPAEIPLKKLAEVGGSRWCIE